MGEEKVWRKNYLRGVAEENVCGSQNIREESGGEYNNNILH